jgi:streptomycin 6-kinase
MHVTAILRDDGKKWLDQLPSSIAEMSVLWNLDVGPPFPAGEFNFVAPALRSGVDLTVLKIAPPYLDNEYVGEAEFIRHRNGNGMVRLLGRDDQRRAILIERALEGRNLAELFAGREHEAIDPAVEVLRAMLGPPPSDYEPKTLDEWFQGMRRAEGTGFPASYTEKTFEIYERLSNQPGRTFYLHGDFHPGNIVSATREPYLAIDPKGIVGHVGYDIGVFLNNFHWWQETHVDIQERLTSAVSRFSEAFDIPPRELREWAFAQMVLGAWWNFADMPEHYDESTLAKADIWNV